MPEIPIPAPEMVIPGFADLPEPIQAVIERLSAPFPVEEVKVRPGAVKRDGSAALALPYGDWWTMYLPRLNDAVGPNNWRITLRPWGEHQIIARLTAFGGLIVSESSGNAKGDANGAQEAEVQAKKRACAEGLMLGLYYYFLPNVWGKGERVGKEFTFAEGEERRCVYEMYARAGLIARSAPGIDVPRQTPPSAPARAAAATPPRPSAARAAAARAALDTAERRVGMRPAGTTDRRAAAGARDGAPASEKQLGLIVALLSDLLTADGADGDAATAAIDAAGSRVGIRALSRLRTRDQLRGSTPALTMLTASKLIDQLKATDLSTARAV